MLLTFIAGRQARRRAHVIRAVSMVLLLVGTIVLALQLGKQRDFAVAGWVMDVHLVVARVAGCLVLPVAFTGIMLWSRPAWRPAHKVCVYLLLSITVIAIATGVWAFSLSVPL